MNAGEIFALVLGIVFIGILAYALIGTYVNYRKDEKTGEVINKGICLHEVLVSSRKNRSE